MTRATRVTSGHRVRKGLADSPETLESQERLVLLELLGRKVIQVSPGLLDRLEPREPREPLAQPALSAYPV